MPLRRRRRATTSRPFLTAEDLRLAVELPLLWILALVRPERAWRSLCYRIESAKARLGSADPAPVASAAARVLGPSQPSFDARAFAIDVAAARSEHHLQILRSRSPRRWDATLALRGREHLDAALAAGHGAVLWVAHFSFNALASKRALHDAGFPVWHVSRPEHGFSKSTFGIAVFNPLRVRAELEYLAGRIVFDRERPSAATFAAQRVLRNNGIVSITAGAWEGQRLARVALLGGTLELAVGAPGFARLAGAALLPVFVVRGGAEHAISVVIEAPLPMAAGGSAEDAMQDAARRFGLLLEGYVRRYPDEWRDWSKLEVPG